MKVEKCKCGKPASIAWTSDNTWCVYCSGYGAFHPMMESSRFRLIAILNWNHWARREAKRIAKGGKGK